MKTSLMLSAALLLACSLDAQAGFIDFESGYSDLEIINSAIDTGDNLVTISTTGNTNSAFSYIAEVGTPPRTGFTTGGNAAVSDDEAVDGRAGGFFLTDDTVGDVAINSADYVFSFADGITDLSMDIFDFRVDGGAQNVGSTATAMLTLFSDEAMTNIVGMTSFTADLQNQPIDGNWENLLVIADGVAVKAVLDLGGVDRGVGVDNISFTTEPPPVNPVPEPSSFVLMGLGAIGLIGFRRRQQRRAAK
ncbi:PEP-CTERM motif protein [Symmachiella macrocystis]|uniref:PEP-CTERM motif protein n=1 Tax=Symmachiella macrocystis TaxID=2527985 RepID=A0A5C6BES9_9PLAN|nr:PEP-CTERM sorting domain-containing protein [Symmachiella macrocystis]TWU08974.1 PEP-CTERM motif protein [Symmachiella macrocystis]